MPVCKFLVCGYFFTLKHFHSVCTEDRGYMGPLADTCRVAWDNAGVIPFKLFT